jgi:hypothetical protein
LFKLRGKDRKRAFCSLRRATIPPTASLRLSPPRAGEVTFDFVGAFASFGLLVADRQTLREGTCAAGGDADKPGPVTVGPMLAGYRGHADKSVPVGVGPVLVGDGALGTGGGWIEIILWPKGCLF